MYAVTKTFKFEAAHRLLTITPKEHHCRALHGHSYVVRASIWVENISGMENPNMLIDFGKLKEFQEQLNEHFDHALILHQDDPIYHAIKDYTQRIILMPNGMDTTAENMAYLFANSINEICNRYKIKKGHIQVDVNETVGNTASYTREIAAI